MFDLKLYKKFAKQQLKGRWRLPVIITIFTTLIISILNFPAMVKQKKQMDELWQATTPYMEKWLSEDENINKSSEPQNIIQKNQNSSIITEDPAQIKQEQKISPEAKALSILLPFQTDIENYSREINAIVEKYNPTTIDWLLKIGVMLIGYIFEITTLFFLLKMSVTPEKLSFAYYKKGYSLSIRGIAAGIWKTVWLKIWSFLFFFPMLIKFYSYRFHTHLIIEYPELTVPQALQMSRRIAHGHKWNLFVLDLSFILWYLLGLITCGVMMCYVIPYHKMTIINSYHALLKEAVESGKISTEELGFSADENSNEENSENENQTESDDDGWDEKD